MPTESKSPAPSAPTDRQGRPGDGRTRRLLIGLLALVVVLYSGIGWYVSGEIIDGMVSSPYEVEYDTDVIAVSTDEITLDLTDAEEVEADADASMGLRWDGGYGRVGPSLTSDGGVQTRPFDASPVSFPR